MPRARRADAPPPSMRGLDFLMQELAVVEEEEEEEEGEKDNGGGGGQAVSQFSCLLCGRFSEVEGVGCLYCQGEADDTFSYEDWEAYSEPEEERAQSAPLATFCGLKKAFLCNPAVPAPPVSSSQDCLLSFALPQKQQLTAEEAERNAEELMAEEERTKKKAAKKRLKKKRQKDRKRQEKHNQELEAKSQARPTKFSDCPDTLRMLRPELPEPEGSSSQGPSEDLTSPGCSTEEEEEPEEELDLTSTFVSKARLKVGTKSIPRKEKAARPERMTQQKVQQEVPRPGLQKTPVEQSMVLADCGNETAKRGCYWEAVLLFTEAVKLNPQEYRFFGNRSFCYEKLRCYPEALQDAQLALHLQPGWPKGLFRQGKALMGLKRYADAARTFEELLRLDGLHSDATAQLHQCQVQLLLQNNFVQCLPPPAWSGLAQEARLPLPGGRPLASSSPQVGAPLASITITNSKCHPVLPSAAPAPAREWFALWVGNLTPRITRDILLRCFQPFGPIDSVRCLPQKFCAFINYTHQEAAEAAYVALQGVEVEGSKLQLQLKHPVHATPPAAKALSGTQQPLKRAQAHPVMACSWQNTSHTKGDRYCFGHFPQTGATAKKQHHL